MRIGVLVGIARTAPSGPYVACSKPGMVRFNLSSSICMAS